MRLPMKEEQIDKPQEVGQLLQEDIREWNEAPASLVSPKVLCTSSERPNSTRPQRVGVVLALAILWCDHGQGQRMLVTHLHHTHDLKKISKHLECFYLSPRNGKLLHTPSSVKDWKDEWFLVEGV